jgi:hypothetical protein
MMNIDISEVSKNLDHIIKNAIPALGAQGLFLMAEQLLHDATATEPTTPRGHARAKAGKRGGVGGTLRQSGKIEKQPDGSLFVGFNTPYATYVHEGQRSDGTRVIQKYTEAGAGAKFLSNKLSMYGDVYLKNLADYIKRGGA